MAQDLQNPQPQFGTLIPSEKTSPNSSQLNINSADNFTRRTSLQSSPIHLAQNMHDLSLSTNGLNPLENQAITSPTNESQQIQQPFYVVKIQNLPSDISLREAYCIFTFAKDFAGFELIPDSNNLPTIFAKFKSLSAASTYSQILESSQIFGPSYPFYLKAEIIDTFAPPLSLSSSLSSSKRPSIGTQRSRFLFSDPFSNEAIAENPELQNTNGVGKSLLIMMESQQDAAREYDQMVRDPWQSSTGSVASNGAIPPNSQPVILNSQGSTNASFSNSSPQTPVVDWDRRRQGSSFFNQSPLLSGQLSSSQISTSLSLNQIAQPQSQQPSQQQQQQQQSQQQQQQSTPSQPLSAPTQPSSLLSASSNQPQSSSSNGQKSTSSAQPALNNNNSQQSSQVDLSLLARVPPPANPADQNPPCNTLYVGNLPPDATEAELRQLFSPQRGFRRLSFKTKTQNTNTGSSIQVGHIHGPMCFVEFEDVQYATRALAELYGRTLPRPGGLPGKGGIRLSFSKNPLGVRGPGQRRTSGFSYNQQQPGYKN